MSPSVMNANIGEVTASGINLPIDRRGGRGERTAEMCIYGRRAKAYVAKVITYVHTGSHSGRVVLLVYLFALSVIAAI